MDVTERKPLLFTNRALFVLVLPMIFDALLAILAGIVDSAMVSSAGETAVSAVSIVDHISVLFISMFRAITLGGTVVTSQYIGSRNSQGAKDSANHLIYATCTIATALALLLFSCVPQLLSLIYRDLEPAVFEQAKVYFYLTLIGYPFMAIGSACNNLLYAMGKNTTAFMLVFGYNIINIICNALLIYGYHMGIAGAAIATTIARFAWCCCGLIILHQKRYPAHFENLLHFKPDWSIMRRILRIGVSNGMESSLFQVGKILISSLVASFGTIAIAANSVSSALCNLGWTTISAIGSALLTVVGRCIGADEPEQARMYTRKLMGVSLVATFILFGGVFLLRHKLVQLYSFGPEALAESAKQTGMGALCTIAAFYSFSFIPNSAFRAAGDNTYSTILTFGSMFTFRVGLSYVLGHFLGLGLTGVWLGCWADWSFRSICNIIRFRSGKWIKQKLV